MKRRTLSLFLLALPLITLCAQQRLRVMTYNLRHGELASLEQLAEFITSQRPDVVLLQEVDINTRRQDAPHQHGRNFITELGYHTQMFAAFGKSIPLQGGYYGLGILSRYPIVSMERYLLPKPQPRLEQRSLLQAVVELDNGQHISVASTHLGLTSAERQLQVESLCHTLLRTDLPVLVAGDFNAVPTDKEIAEGMSGWLRAMPNTAFTFPQDQPKAKIDYIFAHPANRWEVVEGTVPPVLISDHRPVVVEYILSQD